MALVSVQAEEYSYTSAKGDGTTFGNVTWSGVEWNISADNTSYCAWDGSSSKGYQFGSSKQSCKTLTLSTSGIEGTISEIVINTSGASSIVGSCTVTVGGTQFGNKITLTQTATDYTLTGNASGNIVLSYTQTSSKAIYIKSITITYTPNSGGGGGTPDVPVVETVATPVITAESTTFNEGESLFVTIETETEGAEIYYTLDGSDPVENGDLYEGEIELTETTTVKAVAMLDGWNNSEVVEATFTAIDPSAASFKIVASELGYANNTAVVSLPFGDVVAIFDGGTNSSNPPKYYTTGSAIRAYGGNTITFTGAVGVTITGIKLTFATGEGTNAITADCGAFSIDTWTGASNEVKLTIGGTSGHRRIATIEVTYSVGENVVVIATPSITASTSFVGSTTVEITNNEEGTTLYYSTNGEDYVAYTGTLNITETTTVYAKAVDAQGNESAVAEATYTKIEVLSIAEAKAAYDKAGKDVDVAVDLTGAVVTVNNGQYLFIENETTGVNLYNSGAKYAVGTKFTAGYILGTSTVYGKMHQITGAKFNAVETTIAEVEPTEVEIADIKGNNAEWEGRFVKLSGVSVNVNGKTITQGGDTYALYNRFALTLKDAAMCDVEGIVAIYNTTEQLYITKITPFHTLSVTAAGWATLYLDFAAAIPADVEAYTVTEVNNGYVTLTEVEGVLPANTGIIVKADADDYNFVASTGAAADVTGNLLSGTTKDTVIESAAYVLGIKDGIVGLYTATTTGYAEGTFLNNANKAYLPKTAGMNAASYSFRFGEGTTGINEVKGENGEVKAIYDLTGRRVEAITAPGIYVVNGKKTLVK